MSSLRVTPPTIAREPGLRFHLDIERVSLSR